MDAAKEAAALVTADIVGTEDAAPQEGESSPEAAAAQHDEQETAEFELDPEVPDDIAELLAEPDFEAEAEAEIDDDGDDEYEDDTAASDERKKRIALEKKVKWLEEQRVRESKSKWEAEAEKFFPLADTDSITATSRRAFLREAKRQHEALKPKFEKLIGRAKTATDAASAAAREEEKTKAKAAWGTPAAGPGVPAEAAQKVRQNERIEMASGGLSSLIAKKFKEGDYGKL